MPRQFETMSSAPQVQSMLVRTELVTLSVGDVKVPVDFWYRCAVPEKIENELLNAMRGKIACDGKEGVRAKASVM